MLFLCPPPYPAPPTTAEVLRYVCRRFLRLCVLVLLCRLPPCPPPVWRSRSSVPSPLPFRVRPLAACWFCALFGRFLFLFWRRRGLVCLLCGPRLFSRVLLAPCFCGRFRGGSRVRRGGGAPSLLPLRNAPPPLLFPCARPLAAPLSRSVAICLSLWWLLPFCLLITLAIFCHIVSINIW